MSRGGTGTSPSAPVQSGMVTESVWDWSILLLVCGGGGGGRRGRWL